MTQLDEFLENADVPQEETKPLTKPLVCPRCGCQDIEEVADGLWTTTAFTWDEKLGSYKEYDKDTDGCGDRYLQCRNCSDQYPDEVLEQFDMSNPEYKW